MCLVRWVLVLVCPGDCDMLSWPPWLFSRKSSLGAESWSCCNTSQSACDDLCGQGSAGMSMSSGCLAAWFYQCPYFKLLDYRLSRLGHHLEPLNAYLV